MNFYLCINPQCCMSPFSSTNKYWWKNSIYIRDGFLYYSLLQKNRIRTQSGEMFTGGWCSYSKLVPLKIKRIL